MPKSIKPKMSRDELSNFDWLVAGIEFDDGEAVINVRNQYEGVTPVSFSENDLQDMIMFIRRNQQ